MTRTSTIAAARPSARRRMMQMIHYMTVMQMIHYMTGSTLPHDFCPIWLWGLTGKKTGTEAPDAGTAPAEPTSAEASTPAAPAEPTSAAASSPAAPAEPTSATAASAPAAPAEPTSAAAASSPAAPAGPTSAAAAPAGSTPTPEQPPPGPEPAGSGRGHDIGDWKLLQEAQSLLIQSCAQLSSAIARKREVTPYIEISHFGHSDTLHHLVRLHTLLAEALCLQQLHLTKSQDVQAKLAAASAITELLPAHVAARAATEIKLVGPGP
eukprot:g66518.t1